MRYLEEARKAYEGLDRYADIAPAQEGQSNYLAADPATRAAQMDALTEFQNQYRQGGLNAIDRFNAANRQGAQEQTFQNRLAQKQGIAGVYGAQAGQKNADADYTQRRFAGLGEGLDAAGKVIPGMPEGLF